MFYIPIVFIVLAVCSAIVEGYITCQDDFGKVQCYGPGAYCCGMRSEECCWDSIDTFWWFWFSGFFIILVLVTCVACICIRRRRRFASQNGYVVVRQEAQTNYGTVPSGYNYNHPMNGGNAYTNTTAPMVPGVPTAPPAYQEKPPDYNTVATS